MVLITNLVDLYEYENNTYIQTFKSILYYKQCEHPTCTCFGHSCDILREDASPANIQFHVRDCRQSGQHRILSILLLITFHSLTKHMSHVFTENDIFTHTLQFIISGTSSRTALPCWLRHYDPSKHRQLFTNRHGIIAQNTRISSPLKMSPV